MRSDAILRVTPKGVQMVDGEFFEIDALICATGFDTSFRPQFPVINKSGNDLRDAWADEPRSYLSVAAAGFPNYFSRSTVLADLIIYFYVTILTNHESTVASGPNFPLANGTLIPCLEKCVSYALEAARKIQTEGIKSLFPLEAAVNDFQDHKDSLMKDLVWTSGCRSWYGLAAALLKLFH